MDRELKKYLPPVFAKFREFSAIMEAEQPQIETIYESAGEMLEQQFIDTAGDYGLSRWETSLGILPKASESLDDRRFRMLALTGSQLPYTHRKLETRLEQLCGAGRYSVDIDCTGHTVTVQVSLESRNSYGLVEELLKKMVPANMIIMLSLKYNRYALFTAMTHSEMAAFTHTRLRNEVFS